MTGFRALLRTITAAAPLLALAVAAAPVRAETLRFDIAVDPAVAETGVMRHLLVRFKLKTRRAGTVVAPDAPADLRLTTANGLPARRGNEVRAMARAGRTWFLLSLSDNPAAARFRDWLTGEIGRRTLAAFTPRSGPPFTAPEAQAAAEEAPEFDGDPRLGRALAAAHCGRCHSTGDQSLTGSIGSTPSFAALRALPDWAERFMAFYALNPHPAIMQVEGITPPFDPARPPPMVPVEITAEEAGHIQAYAATVPAADLGAPVAAR